MEDGQEFAPERYLDLGHTEHRMLFEGVTRVWDALPKIASYLQFRLRPEMRGRMIGRPYIGPEVYVGPGTVIENGATVLGPAWIGRGCQIRSGCYIRENAIVGDGVVVGNSSELKNCILFDEAEIPHFNYVGDSVIGHHGHLGAGVILSNVRLDRADVVVTGGAGGRVSTGLRKFGAIIGDRAEIGCNAVINPGSLVGRRAIIYPGVRWSGILPPDHIARLRDSIQILERRGGR